MSIVRGIALSILVCAPITPAAAQDEIKPNCDEYQGEVKKHETAIKNWPRVAEVAGSVASRYCAGELLPEKMSVALFEFLADASRELDAIGIPEANFPFRAQLAKAKVKVDADQPIPNMAMLQPAFGTGLRFVDPVRVNDVPACDRAVAAAKAARRVGAQNCRQLLESLHSSYEPLHLMVQRAFTKEVKQYLEGLQRQWDDFLTKSRSQTGLELWLNSKLWREKKTSGEFLEPPERQWILFHPSVVLEHVSKANDGNRTEEGLMIEVAGANWWRNDKWYQPSGASYVWVYSDRAGMRDWANGLAAHFGNKYTIGATRRNGKTGYFLSVDVLELYKDKKKTLQEYTGRLPAK